MRNEDMIIDDIWINIFCLLDIRDFLNIHKSCKKLNHLTNESINKRINNQWKYYCQLLSKDVKANNYIPNNRKWKHFYKILFEFVTNESCTRKIQL